MTAGVSGTFTLVQRLLYALWTIDAQGAGTPAACAARCVVSDVCGGFVWASSVPPCRLVVSSSIAGAVATKTAAAYRRVRFRDDLHIFELPPSLMPAVGVRQSCLKLGMDLPPHTISPAEEAILTIRSGSFIFVDMVVKANGTAATLSTGVDVPNTGIPWAPNYPLMTGKERCVMIGGIKTTLFYDSGCNIAQNLTQICVRQG
ncbi:uncharacterized protein LOC125179150 [Hyalella azteca]|uniref:Uncharacterized protein LOC125179150 n=1 Tax=Hyalella azteca TaxID=294128 RepID=A0A979FT64_HYAAZ|nr:uncharacterized protein LOC125179150 [Hyalella azteca]